MICILVAQTCGVFYFRAVILRVPTKKETRFRGFTLVELLVVISIITTLATVASLAGKGAIVASRQAASATNLRNIGIALRMYADDNGGRFPETTHSASLGRSWIFALEGYLGRFDETRICPADPKGKQRLAARGSSYILNSYLFVPAIGPFGEPMGPALNRVNLIPEPSRTLMAFVCSDRTGVGPGNDHTHSNLWNSWSAVCNDISPDRFGGGSKNRDVGRSVYLYVDGRVEALNANEVRRKIQSGINIAKPPGVLGL
jgi:prepilin-type N-terminal cleavage/methylation domain-containing protein